MDKTKPGLISFILYTLMPGPARGYLYDLGFDLGTRLCKQQTGGLLHSLHNMSETQNGKNTDVSEGYR